jgi:starch synthase
MADISSTTRILFLAAEAEPFVKVGGLGDVAGSLPGAIHRLSLDGSKRTKDAVDIRLVIPYHGNATKAENTYRLLTTFDILHGTNRIPAKIFDSEISGVPIYFISGAPIDPEGPVYSADSTRDGLKYIFFSLAALELARSLNFQPHLLHANDWHTAPAVYALSILCQNDPFFQQTASLLSIHNLPYLGLGTEKIMESFGLPAAINSGLPGWAQQLPLPTGLVSADHIVTVSPTYAREILTPEFGSGLEDFLQTRRDSISGILNGLDIDGWNPASDPHLHMNFSLEEIYGRKANKTALQLEFGLEPDPRRLLMGMVTRMDNQKGVDLALGALELLAKEDETRDLWQVVILGSGSPELEEIARKIEAENPGQCKAILRYDPSLSRLIYGGSDALLIPSRYEPCGLAQMIAMRYGCVPIARATGGLKDTIIDVKSGPTATGFLFEDPTPHALAAGIKDALDTFANKEKWKKLQQNGMAMDFSWEKSAREYLALYKSLIAVKSNNKKPGEENNFPDGSNQ